VAAGGESDPNWISWNADVTPTGPLLVLLELSVEVPDGAGAQVSAGHTINLSPKEEGIGVPLLVMDNSMVGI
jgi:hypothetical protein